MFQLPDLDTRYLIFTLKRTGSFSDWCPAPLFPYPEQLTHIYRYKFQWDQQVFLYAGPSWSVTQGSEAMEADFQS